MALQGHFATMHPRELLSSLSLRTSLILLLIAVLSLFIGDRARDIIKNRDQEIANSKAQILELARRGADRQAELLSQAKTILQLTAADAGLEPHSPTACQLPFRRIIREMHWLLSMSIVNAEGDFVCTSAVQARIPSISDREYFKQAVGRRTFVISDYITSRLTGKPIIAAAMPRISNGTVSAVYIATIDISWLSELATKTGLASQSDVLLFDSRGTVVAASLKLADRIGKGLQSQPELWNKLREGDGVLESPLLDGKERLIGHAALPDTAAVLAVMRERSAVLGRAHEDALLAIGKITGVGLFCLLGVWLGGEQLVVKPIENLTKEAARIGSGDLNARVDTNVLSPELRALAKTFNSMAAKVAEHENELQVANAKLQGLARTDGLTGLANRRHFDEQFELEWQRATRRRTSLALLIIDVDHFKRFNDRYGHGAGDAGLREVAGVLRGAARRAGELAARAGGEEFAILMPGCDLSAVLAVAEEVRARTEELSIKHEDSPLGHVTISVGAAAMRPIPGQSARLLLDAADAALYDAKRGGRNRVAASHRPDISLVS